MRRRSSTDNRSMLTLPDTLHKLRSGQLAGLKRLDLSCGLTEFPPEIFDLADSLEVLNLSQNALSSLPDDLQRLHKLRIIFCSDNLFTELPAALGQCKNLQMVGFKSNQIKRVPAAALPAQLRWLVLTDNQIEVLPDAIGNCSHLQKMALAGNRLRSLPKGLVNCQRLELLRVSANQLTELPAWLVQMPRLAWLAFAGNPLSPNDAAVSAPARTIAWSSLSLQNKLGEGASGVIYRAQWQAEAGAVPTDVAVKLFKGAVTSDGWPHSELAASQAAGPHPHLIGLLGTLVGHPDDLEGLVMPLIPPSFATLAAPPSLDSCTRDVYADATRFSVDQLMRIALAAASAGAHLHRQGLLHGDLYAHNLQCDAQGNALLGDMGATSFLPNDLTVSQALQRLEVRAFGCLLEELLTRCDSAAPRGLVKLRDDCLQSPTRRPLFENIVQQLKQLKQHQIEDEAPRSAPLA